MIVAIVEENIEDAPFKRFLDLPFVSGEKSGGAQERQGVGGGNAVVRVEEAGFL